MHVFFYMWCLGMLYVHCSKVIALLLFINFVQELANLFKQYRNLNKKLLQVL